MKKITLLSAIFCSLLCSLIFTCKKPENNVFNNSARIKGTVYFQDLSTGLLDTALTAQLKLTFNNSVSTQLVQNLTNGTFDISSLSAGNYSLDITYDISPANSTKTIHYQVITNFTLKANDLNLTFNQTLTATQTHTPTLQVTVTDASKAIIANAQVALYSDYKTLLANMGTTMGSLRSGTTNASGIVVFDGLQAQNYYVAAFSSNGGQLISNQLTESSPVTVLDTPKYTAFTTVVSPTGLTLQLTILDNNGSVLPNANVGLYSDLSLLINYRGTGTGSIMSGLTNSLGIITFYNLQSIPYYISAYSTVGVDSLSNKGSDATPVSLLANTLNPKTILLKLIVPSSLSVNVTDHYGALIANASVCIYSDPNLLANNRGTCTGSLQSSATNAQGNIVFTNLQLSVTYYISAYKSVGTEILSNNTTDITSPIQVIANGEKTTVIIK